MVGLGFPEMLLILVWLIPAWILWKFYQVLSRMADSPSELLHGDRDCITGTAEIAQAHRDR